MTEKLLQFIWQNRYFQLHGLHTTSGESVTVITTGQINHHQGPDFLNARLQLNGQIWIGNIELHVFASQWEMHQHSKDPLYKNVILHVVWKEDKKLGLPFPVLELEHRVSNLLLSGYERLMQSPQFIACQDQWHLVSTLHIHTWKQRMVIERLQQKAEQVFSLLRSNNFHWEEVFWWMMAYGFGIKVNSDSFLRISQNIPFNVLMKHKSQLIQLEALLLGQAGVLNTRFNDHYPNLLKKEYLFLKNKYQLSNNHFPLYYLRMRPANFPTVRLAQLAALIHLSEHLFSACMESENLHQVMALLKVRANDYWHYHYFPDKKVSFQIKYLGKGFIETILINVIIPILYAYGLHQNRNDYCDKAVRWMEMIPGEKNTVIRHFEELGVATKNAFDTQALLHLKKEYCNAKRCLECVIGFQLLKK